MTGFEPLLKVAPLLGIFLAAAMGYGQIQADIKSIQKTQEQQFVLIQDQLSQIQDRLNK